MNPGAQWNGLVRLTIKTAKNGLKSEAPQHTTTISFDEFIILEYNYIIWDWGSQELHIITLLKCDY